jgi:hypothetical protein
MSADLDAGLLDISGETWKTAADRLGKTGVFADEEHSFPSSLVLRRNLAEFERGLRSKGYTGGALEIGDVDQLEEGVDFLAFDHQKHGDIHSAAAAWYGEYVERWHRLVAERVQDWVGRLDELKRMMENWLPVGMSIVDRPPTPMHENLMMRFNVPPAQMPTFEVRRGIERVMRVQPKGLWIIGANGRVDLTTPTASYILVDKSEPLSGTPDWHYYTSSNKLNSTQLGQAEFLRMLR